MPKEINMDSPARDIEKELRQASKDRSAQGKASGQRGDDLGQQIDVQTMFEQYRRQNRPTFTERIQDAAAYVIANVRPSSWMSPGQPLTPMAPEEQQPDGSRARAFDYPVGVNLQYQPRSNGGPTFTQLRALAECHDITRICIEKRKAQMAAIDWEVRMRDDKEKDDARLKTIRDLLLYPDKIHDFATWVGMLLEEMLVIDAPCSEPVTTIGGELVRLDLVDGATMKCLVDITGRRPEAPSPAWQQIIKGVVKNDFSAEELIYQPGNPRVWKQYGMSPVEQIIVRINLAIRRDASIFDFYTAGNVPEGIFMMPEGVNPAEIREFEEMFNALLGGNMRARRRIKFIPGGKGAQFIETKKVELKDVFDEWLARIVCACFSLPPTPYTGQVNRATAESAQDTSENEGLLPWMNRVKSFINYALFLKGYGDIEFNWKESVVADVLKQAQADDLKVRNATKSIDEVRQEQGLEPWGIGPGIMGADGTFKPLPVKENAALIADMEAKAAERADLQAQQMAARATGEAAAAAAAGGKEKVVDTAKAIQASLAKKKSVIFKLTPDAVPHDIAAKLAKIYIDFFQAQGKKAAKLISRAYAKLNKAIDASDVDAIIDELNTKGWSFLIKPTEKALLEVGQRTAATSLQQLRLEEVDPDADYNSVLDQASAEAKEYARLRAAEIVGKRYDEDGDLVDNDGWSITQTTRDMLRSKVSQAIAEGWSADHLADEIEGDRAFSSDRALLIARTELAFSHVEGNLSAWRASGVVQMKRSVLGSEHDPKDVDECVSNAEQGWIPLDDAFDDGNSAPPFHPNCVCDLEAEVVGPDQVQEPEPEDLTADY